MTELDEIIHQPGDMTQAERDSVPVGSTDPIPRYVPPNPYKYTPSELAKRSNAIATMTERYPHCPHAWICNLYDILEHKSPEEIKIIMDTKAWEGPVKLRQNGGVIKDSFCVLEPGQDPHLPLNQLKIESK